MSERLIIRTVQNITYIGSEVKTGDSSMVTIKVNPQSDFLVSIPTEEIIEIIK